jgi:polar amino acid transport system substrate-binding protein
MKAFSMPDLWGQILFWLVLAIFAAHIMWLLEKQRRTAENDLFHKRYLPGMHDGIYWAGVTTATVGYGDKVPIRSV